MNKILVLNQATLNSNYRVLEDAFRNTWASNKDERFKAIHYYGKYNQDYTITDIFKNIPEDGKVTIENDNLIVGTYDNSYPPHHEIYKRVLNSKLIYKLGDTEYKINDSRGEKLIRSLEYCLNNFEFDFLLRICSTTYVDVNKMLSVLDSIKPYKVYDGARNMYNYEYYFVAGHTSLMSRDVVEQAVLNKELYLDSPYPEDLALGKLIMHDLNYTSFTDQQINGSIWTTVSQNEDDVLLSNNDETFCYRIGIRPEIFYKIHNKIINK